MMRSQVRRARALRAVLTGPLGAEMLLVATGILALGSAVLAGIAVYFAVRAFG